MSEPHAVAASAEEFLPGLWTWSVADERIGGFTAAAHAFRVDGGVVLIDPLPVAQSVLEGLDTVRAICLTTSGHQRSSWRLRRELGAPVWAPAPVKQVDEEPDVRYSDGETVAGCLRAIFTPGAGTAQFSLLLEREGGVLFTPDLFAHESGEALSFVPAEYMHDPAEARRTAEKLLTLEFAVLCTGHGIPVTNDPKAAIRAALAL